MRLIERFIPKVTHDPPTPSNTPQTPSHSSSCAVAHDTRALPSYGSQIADHAPRCHVACSMSCMHGLLLAQLESRPLPTEPNKRLICVT